MKHQTAMKGKPGFLTIESRFSKSVKQTDKQSRSYAEVILMFTAMFTLMFHNYGLEPLNPPEH